MAHSPKLRAFFLCSALILCGLAANAESRNPEDYPFRLHIFSREEHTHYHRGVEMASTGDGRANLFASGDVHAVDFSFDCGQKVQVSVGYETYMAKWKKPGKQLVVLLPVFGKSGTFESCTFNVDVRDVAYYKHNHEIETETPEAFKTWMAAHNYDPERGKNEPVNAEPKEAPEAPPPAQ